VSEMTPVGVIDVDACVAEATRRRERGLGGFGEPAFYGNAARVYGLR
jgi:hypothetical protein